MLKTIQTVYAGDIPPELEDACLDLDCEFPFHCSHGIICISDFDMDNAFVKWLFTQGLEFPEGASHIWVGVFAT